MSIKYPIINDKFEPQKFTKHKHIGLNMINIFNKSRDKIMINSETHCSINMTLGTVHRPTNQQIAIKLPNVSYRIANRCWEVIGIVRKG